MRSRWVGLICALALSLAAAGAQARVATGGVVNWVGQSWDTDTSAGAGGCAVFQLQDGRMFAIFPLYTPGNMLTYQTILSARVTGAPIQFWDEGPVGANCHFGHDNQPLHYIYSPSF